MADIIDLNRNISKEEISQASDNMNTVNDFLEMIGDADMGEAIVQSLGYLLGMPDEEFEVIAPGILQSYLLSINNPNDKIALVQALNAQGATAEDLTDSFIDFQSVIEDLEDVSQPKKDFFKQLIGGLVNAVNETEGIAKRLIQIPIELCHPDAKLPQYAHTDDSGMDLFALDDYVIAPGETKLIPTGIKAVLPPGYEFQIRPKSGRSLKTKLRIANTPSTIDAGYRGEIGVIIENIEAPIKNITYEFDEETHHPIITAIEHGANHYIGKGEKFAQLILTEVSKAALYRVEKVEEDTERGAGGYGSSGLK